MMQAILDAITCWIGWFGAAFGQVFVDLFEWSYDMLVYLFDVQADFAISVFNSFDFTFLLTVGGAWSSMPSWVADVMSAIGIYEAVMITVGAIIIRLLLQLIPFVRLGL